MRYSTFIIFTYWDCQFYDRIIDEFECFCSSKNYKTSAGNFKAMPVMTSNKFQAIMWLIYWTRCLSFMWVGRFFVTLLMFAQHLTLVTIFSIERLANKFYVCIPSITFVILKKLTKFIFETELCIYKFLERWWNVLMSQILLPKIFIIFFHYLLLLYIAPISNIMRLFRSRHI